MYNFSLILYVDYTDSIGIYTCYPQMKNYILPVMHTVLFLKRFIHSSIYSMYTEAQSTFWDLLHTLSLTLNIQIVVIFVTWNKYDIFLLGSISRCLKGLYCWSMEVIIISSILKLWLTHCLSESLYIYWLGFLQLRYNIHCDVNTLLSQFLFALHSN